MLALEKFQSVAEVGVICADCLAAFLGVVIHRPRGGLRMHDKHIHAVVSAREQHAYAAHGIVKCLVFVPPGLLNIHRRGVIPLAQTSVGISLEMLAEQIYSAHHLILENPLEFIVPHIVSAHGKCLGEHMSFARLPRNGTDLIGRERIAVVSAEPIHTRYGEVLIVRHARAVRHKLAEQRFLQDEVTRKFESVVIAPIVNLFHKVF